MSEITVVIPNYNGMKYLPECMTSLCERQENAPEYEVLIIDNASADGSVESGKGMVPEVGSKGEPDPDV